MKQGTIFFHPIEGSGPLTISWSSEPKGDAVEADQGFGVGFFSDSGNLLCVIFDEVRSEQDQQKLKFKKFIVEINVNQGKINYTLTST